MSAPASGGIPTLRVAGERTTLLGREALEREAGDALLAWMGGQRWFSRRGEAGRVEVRDVVALDGDGRLVLAVLAAGGAEWLAPLELRDGEAGAGTIARVEGADGTALLADASGSPLLHRAIARALRGEVAVQGLQAERIGALADLPEETDPARVGSAEQSNTSLIFGDRAIVKLFRRLEEGENPDVEIGRVLGGPHPFEGTPQLLGVLSLARGEHRTIAIAQQLVPGARDAWALLLDVSRVAFEGGHGAKEAAGSAEELARGLGRLTRIMHAALAQASSVPGFETRAATAEDVRRWGDATKRQIVQALDRLAAAVRDGVVPDVEVSSAEALEGWRDAFDRRVDALVTAIGVDAGGMMRHHGDYHLGQVIVGEDGRLYAIDFEGEPARPLAERRAPSSPLRDVAGMLRSFAYLAGTVVRERRSDPAAPKRGREFERHLRDRFLGAYIDGEDAASLALPVTPAAGRALLDLFELEKVFYEISYELGHRPDWVWIPLAGATAMMLGPEGEVR